MEIGPVSGNNSMRRPESAAPKEKNGNPKAGAPQDRAEFSDNARSLLGELADKELKSHGRDFAPARELENGREALLEAVRKRIKEGYYRRPDVGERIADRLLDDLKLTDGTGNDS